MQVLISYLFLAIGIYLLIGLFYSIFFLRKKIYQIDPDTRGSKLGFKLLILPGLIALWPLMMRKPVQ